MTGGNMDGKSAGHIAAVITIFIWGMTFISTKVLLKGFTPVEILFFRFSLGFFALLIVYPHRLKGVSVRQEITFAAAGLCGICMYYLLENIALTYTLSSNVGVIISIAPFFTAVLTRLFMNESEPLKPSFFIGFAAAMTGICLISWGGAGPEFNPTGDMLAAAAALVWACYSVLSRRIGSFGYNTIQTTRRIFAYGILFMLPAFAVFGFSLGAYRFLKPVYLFNILFLGLGASALCFVTWNFSVKVLGAVKTSVYIYMVPVVTVVASVLILGERLTPTAAIGALLTLAGLFISEGSQLRSHSRGKCGKAKSR